jgi:hypothetical protein
MNAEEGFHISGKRDDFPAEKVKDQRWGHTRQGEEV